MKSHQMVCEHGLLVLAEASTESRYSIDTACAVLRSSRQSSNKIVVLTIPDRTIAKFIKRGTATMHHPFFVSSLRISSKAHDQLEKAVLSIMVDVYDVPSGLMTRTC
eukprot:scaffold1900_cov123-Cylindrotheca_fusiformis.AAC.8